MEDSLRRDDFAVMAALCFLDTRRPRTPRRPCSLLPATAPIPAAADMEDDWYGEEMKCLKHFN